MHATRIPSMLTIFVRFALIASMGLVTACAPELNWREVRPAQADGLVAMFPCKPDAHHRPVRLPGMAYDVDLHVVSCQQGDATWALSYATVSGAHDVTPALAGLLTALRDNLGVAGRLAQSRDLGPTVVPHMTPQDAAHIWFFQAQRPDGLGRPMDLGIRGISPTV
jgi:hypothetical protein